METIKFKLKDEEYELEEIEIKYLFPYFFRFDNKNGTTLLKVGTTSLSGRYLIEFKECVFDALSELLLDCYVEPPKERRQKHPTLFEKFVLEGKKYIVDYTTSILGRLMYTLYLRLSFIEKAAELGTSLTIIKS